jgi:hypothetical protein
MPAYLGPYKVIKPGLKYFLLEVKTGGSRSAWTGLSLTWALLQFRQCLFRGETALLESAPQLLQPRRNLSLVGGSVQAKNEPVRGGNSASSLTCKKSVNHVFLEI